MPRGTETDFSSIPWLGRLLVRWSKVDVAGVVHDRLYQTGELEKPEADRVWRIVAQAGEHHANAFQAWAGWLALVVWGWRSWPQHQRESAESPASKPSSDD